MFSAPTRCFVGLTLFFAVSATVAEAATVTENFSDFDPAQWVIGQDSFWNEALENFYLAPARDDQRGRLYYAAPFTVSSFTASFDYHVFGGSGADGLTFAFVRDPNYTTSGNEGKHLDFTGADGYAVEFDTYYNSSWDPAGRHIALIQDSTRNHLSSVKIETRGTHHVEIRFSLGNLVVVFDGNEVLTYQIPDFVPFLGYFGFTAATGDSNDNHVIDNVVLTFGPMLVVMVRGATCYKVGCDGGCGSDGLDDLKRQIEADMRLKGRTLVQIFCSYDNCDALENDNPKAGANRAPVDFLKQLTYQEGDQVVLIGHSHGGFYVYELALRRDDLVRKVPIRALITMDPIDWASCRQCDFRYDCDQSGSLKDPPGVDFSNYVQRTSWAKGFDVGNDSDATGDSCDSADLSTLTNMTCIITGVRHHKIDNYQPLKDGVCAILADLLGS